MANTTGSPDSTPTTVPGAVDPAWLAVLDSPDLAGLEQFVKCDRLSFSEILDEGVEQLDMHELGEILPSLVFHAASSDLLDAATAADLEAAMDHFHYVRNNECAEALQDVLSGICVGLSEAVQGRFITLHPTANPEAPAS
jgi:hypothetical protein